MRSASGGARRRTGRGPDPATGAGRGDAGGSPALPALRAAWPALVLACAALLPFLGKAHTVDDVTFLSMAEHALRDPLHPTAFEMVADGERLRLSSRLVTGPVMAWLLAPAAAAGGAEWLAHLVQLAFLAAAILATSATARRLGLTDGAARLAALLVAASPAVLPMAATAMADVPAMALGAAALERTLAFRAGGRRRDAALAALLLALAALTRTQLVLMVPVAALLLRSRPRAALALALAAAAAVGLGARLTADPQAAAPAGGFLGPALARFDAARLPANVAAFAAHLVTVVPLGLAWLLAGPAAAARSPWTWVALAAAAALGAATGYGPAWLAIPVMGLGLASLAGVLGGAARGRDPDAAALALAVLAPLAAAGYDHLPAKFMAAAAPAAALLAARALDGAAARVAGGVLVAAGLAMSLLIVHADAQLSNAGRLAAREQVAPRVADGERVWALGNWGFQWYASRAGATTLAHQPPHPRPGDLVVTSGGTRWGDPREAFPPADRLEVVVTRSTLGRVVSGEDGAGYWSNAWGPWPWTPRNGPVEIVTVWRVR